MADYNGTTDYTTDTGNYARGGYPYGLNNPKRIDLDRIDDMTLAQYGLTPQAVKSYMFGMTVQDAQGNELGDNFYNSVIASAVSEVEQQFDICILPRIVPREHHDYYENEYNSYSYITLYKRPILQVIRYQMVMNDYRLIDYPSDWWKIYSNAGQIQIFPAPLLQATGIMPGNVGAGILGIPSMWLSGGQMIQGNSAPQVFDLDYVAGMLPISAKGRGISRDFEMPLDLQQLILKHAAEEILQQWGRLIVGAGIAGYSRSIDGLSESVETTQSAMYTGSRADIDILDKDIAKLEASLNKLYTPAFTTI